MTLKGVPVVAMSIGQTAQVRLDRLTEWFAGQKSWLVHLLPVFGTIFAKLYLSRIADLDLFARVAVGRLIVLHGRVPLTDPFAYTPTKPVWYDHEWLAGLIFYHVSQLGGDVGLFICNAVFALSTIAILYLAQRSLTNDHASAAIWLLLCMVPCTGYWLPVIRAHSVTSLGLASFLLCFVRYRAHGDTRLFALLPLITAVWVNCHAGFVVGLGCLGVVVGCLVLERAPFWKPFVCLLACLGATLLTPYGPPFLTFVFEAVIKDRSSVIEWQTVSLLTDKGLFLGLILFIGIVGLKQGWRSIPLEGRFLLVVLLPFGVRYQRLLQLFCLVVAVYGTSLFAAFLQMMRAQFPARYQVWRRCLALVLAGSVPLAAGCFGSLLWEGERFSLRHTLAPVHAMEWLRQHRSGGRLLVHFNEGSYALWRGYPRFQVSLDGRYEEVYPDSTVDAVLGAYGVDDPHHQHYVQQVAPDYILLCTMSTPGVDHRKFGRDWWLIYEDRQCKLLSREPNTDGRIGTAAPGIPAIWEPVF